MREEEEEEGRKEERGGNNNNNMQWKDQTKEKLKVVERGERVRMRHDKPNRMTVKAGCEISKMFKYNMAQL